MRYYGFCNFMLSSVQQGVQNFHVCHELFNKYAHSKSPATDVLLNWSRNHKTAIFLNGGNASGIRDIYTQLCAFGEQLDLPYAKFHEDMESLDNSMTACGIVVPTVIVDLSQSIREGKYADCVSTTEYELASFLNQFQLAR